MGKTINRSSSPRLAVIQVDGVSRKHLDQALKRGLMPHLKERIDSGKLNLDTYNTGLPSQTTVGAILAGSITSNPVSTSAIFSANAPSVMRVRAEGASALAVIP